MQKRSVSPMVYPAVVTVLGTWTGLTFRFPQKFLWILFFLGVVFYAALGYCRKKKPLFSTWAYRRRSMAPYLYVGGLILLGALAACNAQCNKEGYSCLSVGSRVDLCLQVCEPPQAYLTRAGRTYLRFNARLLAASDSAAHILCGKGATPQPLGREKVQVWLASATDEQTCLAEAQFPIGQVFYSRCRVWEVSATEDSYGKYLARQGIYRRAFVYRWTPGPLRPTWADKIQLLRYSLADKWSADSMAGSSEKALLEGICLGYKANMDKGLKEAYAAAGASHILAVSGLHVGVLYATVLWLLGWLGRKRAPLVAVCFIWLYAVMTGLSASVVRACLMLTLHALGRCFHRHGDSMNALAVAAFVLLVIKPSNLYDWGFQLSFTAVASLLLFFPLLRNLLSVRSRVGRFIWEIVCCTLAVQIGSLWLMAGLFGSISLVGLPANLLVIPLGTLIIYVFVVFLAGCVIAPLTPWLCTQAASVMLWLARCLNKTVTFAASLPAATLPIPSDILMQVILFWVAVYIYHILKINTSKR